jgi:hypothetical protein
MARLYADEDFPLPVVEELRHLGHDVRTVAQRVHDAVTAAPNLVNQFIRIIRPNPPATP